VCEIANDNAPGQIVISGRKAAVEAAVAAVKDLGVRKAMLLPVSAPFHCSLMQPAADAMAEALAGVRIAAPSVPLVANVTAQPTRDPEAIRRQLVEQVTGRVRWRETLAFMAGHGVDRMAEAGAGKVLTGMLKRAAPNVAGAALNGPEDLAAFAADVRDAF
jgi:[acyl-carrier-protein] S-malonyltransferase